MNPQATISYMAVQAERKLVDRDAARGWMAEQAAELSRGRKRDVAEIISRVMTSLFARPRQVVREATIIDMPAGTASPCLDRAA
jgi:hypothetical protein